MSYTKNFKNMMITVLLSCILIFTSLFILSRVTNIWSLLSIISVPFYPFIALFISEPEADNLYTAVMTGTGDDVARLIAEGADLEYLSHNGMTPLLAATALDRHNEAIQLIDAGANVFATSPAGNSAGRYLDEERRLAEYSNSTDPKKIELLNKTLVVKAKLQEKGFPFPAPSPEEVREMREQGLWPPISE